MPTTQARLKELFRFDAETGEWERLVRTSNSVRVGKFSPFVRIDGYTAIRVDAYQYLAHRLAWLYVHGEWPNGQIDHINGDKADNRISNLRDVSCSVNQQNQKKHRVDNVTGFMGVSPNGRNFLASIRIGNRSKNLGTYKTPEEAHAVYLAVKREMHAGCTI